MNAPCVARARRMRAALLTNAVIASLTLASEYNPDANFPHPRAGVVSSDLNIQLDSRGRMLPPATVNIFGLVRPVTVHWATEAGVTTVVVGEKSGIIKKLTGWIGQPTTVLLDLTARIASWGDHGLTGLYIHDGYLWVSYMVAKAPWGSTGCTDHGQLEGRGDNLASIEGCAITGRVSRFPFAGGDVTGPEEVVVDGDASPPGHPGHFCVQFSTHSVASPMLHNGKIHVEWGDGAAFAMVDAGFLGHNPCNDTAPFLGAFRSQNPATLNGKVIAIDPATLEWEVVSSGHRNGYRLTSHTARDGRTRLYATDTGWYTYEEVNEVVAGGNYGWPCYEGPEPAGVYNLQAVYPAVCASKTFNPPAIAYKHPDNPPPGNVMSISAVGGNPENGRLYYGDYTQGWIRSVDDVTLGDVRTETVDAFPVEIRYSPRGLIYVDHTHGMVRSLALNAADTPFSPSASAAPPFARITPAPNCSLVWAAGAPNSTLVFLSEQNVEGREGANYNWTATLLYGCNPRDDSCLALPLVATGVLGGRNLTLGPGLLRHPGTVEVTLQVNSYQGFGAVAQTAYAAAAGSGGVCTCRGNRTLTAAYRPSPSRAPPVGAARAGAVDTRSALFIGLVAAFCTVAAIVAVAAALYASGALGALARRASAEGLTRPLRRPGTGSAGGGGGSADPPGGEPRTLTVAATPVTTAAAAARVSAVAARRSANIPPLDDDGAAGGAGSGGGGEGAGDGAAASAPARPSPADKGAPADAATPAGAKRV